MYELYVYITCMYVCVSTQHTHIKYKHLKSIKIDQFDSPNIYKRI